MPVLTLEANSAIQRHSRLSPLVRLVRRPLRIPAWAAAVAVVLVGLFSFAAGRTHPPHHYVSYFGYPMVLDTNTGKACYAAPPKPSDSAPVQDAAYTPDSSAGGVAVTASAGPSIPLCGHE
ncbi:MAG TPA: hypothetical protein VKB38_01450 [Terracidiphilus sp.]|nr:hypothetical protein [Terracidiphilus sp.]